VLTFRCEQAVRGLAGPPAWISADGSRITAAKAGGKMRSDDSGERMPLERVADIEILVHRCVALVVAAGLDPGQMR